MPATDRGKPSKKKRRPSATQRARAQERSYGSQGRAVERQADRQQRERQPRPSTALRPLGDTRPLAPQQRAARARTDRARHRLPPRALPHVPIIEDPTPAQTRAARRIITGAITRAAGPAGGGADRLAARRQVEREFLDDPRMRRAIRHYSQASERQMALTQADRFGVPGYRGDREQIGRALLATQGEARPGPGPTRIGIPGLEAASINVDALRRGVLAAAPGLRIRDPATKLFEAAARDVKSLASAPFVGGVELARAGLDVARYLPDAMGPLGGLTRGQGSTDRLERLGAGTWEGIKESVPGQLAQGDVEGAIKSAREHPLFAALDLSAAGAIAGRTTGAVMRGVGSTPEAGGLRGALARGGSTVRPPLAMVDDGGTRSLVERRYSKDSVRKTGQVVADAARKPLLDGDGNVVTVEQRGRRVPVLLATPAERKVHLNRQADFEASRANSLERMVRHEAEREFRVRGVKGRRAKDLVSMVVEGTITTSRHFEDDLREEAGRIHGELRRHEQAVAKGEPSPVYRHEGEVRAARERLKLVADAVSNPKVLGQKDKIVAAGEAIGRRLNEREREAVKLGLLTPGRAHRARLSVSALAHMGARHYGERELRALERAGVQVREPQALARHEAARSAATSARGERVAAEKAVEQLRAKRSRLVGAQSSRRGRRGMEGGKAAATTAERTKLEKINADLKAARATVAEKRTAERKATRDLERTPKPPLQESIRGPGGRFLSNEQIETMLRDRGRDPESIAYLPHRTDVRGKRAFHTQFRPGSRGSMEKGETRTGSAYLKGVTESSAALIRDQGVRQATQLSKAKELDRMVADHGIARPDGRYFTGREALEAADRIASDTGTRLVPMRAFAAKLDAETQRIIREDLQGPGAMDSLGLRLLNDRIITEAEPRGSVRNRNAVLVPEEYLERLQRHLRPAGDIQKFFQLINRPFRFAVLAQPRWLVGNFVEPYVVRLTTTGSGLNVFGLAIDVTAANRALRRMERSKDPRVRHAAAEMRAHQEGGLFIGGRGANVRVQTEDLKVGGAVYGQMVSKLPVVAQGFDLVRAIGRQLMKPGNVYFRMNRAIERVAQDASIGHSLRQDIHEFSGSWLKSVRVQAKALDEAARGLVNTPTQRRFMREQHELLGKYEGFPPWLRELVQGPMPFLPWALNAARFVFWTMPAHRTIQTALLTKVNDVVAKDWQEMHAGTPPGGLRLAIPTKRGGWVDLIRYMPWGLTGPIAEGVEESPATAFNPVIDQFAPQFGGAVAAVQGKDPFGRPLQVDPSERQGRSDPTFGEQLGIAGLSLAEALVPYVAQARRVREGGGTGYAGSTVLDPDVKPGSDHMSGARRTFDPFRPTYLRAPTGGRAVRRMPGHMTPDERIDAALERLDATDANEAAAEDRISRALERLSP